MRIGLLSIALIFGSCAGCASGFLESFGFRQRSQSDLPKTSSPYPHFAAPFPGGISLRFAMVHDVIHERFPVHGPAYYQKREQDARQRLKALPADSQEAFDLTDDVAVGMDRLGRPAEGIPLLREKLERQKKQGLFGRDLYTTYANLGTLIIHANMKAATTGDMSAKEKLKEGIGFIRDSITVNPQAHFGREEWQLHIASYLLIAIDKPTLLTQYDCVGNEFGEGEPSLRGRANVQHEYERYEIQLNEQFDERGELIKIDNRSKIRGYISKVGGRYPKAEGLIAEPVPFDEPVLGMIGMWRQGGGANPYFAVSFGEIMSRVGQRYIAWTAYERAAQLADRYGWQPAHVTFLREYCRKQQERIEAQLPAGEREQLRPRFEAELAYGKQFQREYQEYEAKRIAAGADLRDEHFYDDFYRGREPIATPIGESEWLAINDPKSVSEIQSWSVAASALLWGGIVMFSVVILGRIYSWMHQDFERYRPRRVNELPPEASGA